jgi:arylsulfatase A-like enzyme
MLGDHQILLRRSAPHVNATFLDWASRHSERPFFAVLNNFDAHQPYKAPAPFNTAFMDTPPRYWVDEYERVYPADERTAFRDAYDTCLLYLDSELDRLLAALQGRGVLDNTLVIVTADHGEEFGEYQDDVIIHGRSINFASLHVPLVMVYPKSIPAATRRSETVSLRDIPATVMSIVAPGESHPFPGHSLADYARGQVPAAVAAEPRLSIVERHSWAERDDKWPAAFGHLFSLTSGDLQFVVDGRGKEHLFDIANDAWSKHDLVNDSTRAAEVVRFRSVLDSLVGAAGQRKFRAGAKGRQQRESGGPPGD